MTPLVPPVLPLAHTAHWLVDVLYVAPVVAIVGWISVRALLERRRAAPSDPSPASAGPGPDPPA